MSAPKRSYSSRSIFSYSSGLDPAEQKVVTGRLERLRGRIDAEPKSRRWRMRNQVGDKVRWYAEPEQEQPGGE